MGMRQIGLINKIKQSPRILYLSPKEPLRYAQKSHLYAQKSHVYAPKSPVCILVYMHTRTHTYPRIYANQGPKGRHRARVLYISTERDLGQHKRYIYIYARNSIYTHTRDRKADTGSHSSAGQSSCMSQTQ